MAGGGRREGELGEGEGGGGRGKPSSHSDGVTYLPDDRIQKEFIFSLVVTKKSGISSKSDWL